MLRTIKLLNLSQPRPDLREAGGRQGFEQWREGEWRSAGRVSVLAGSIPDLAAFRHDHLRSGHIDPIGCHFLPGVHIAGMMYPFQDSALIIDDSHLSLVSQAWIAAYPSHVPGGDRNRKVHFIDGLVLPVGGPGHQTYGHWIIDYLPRVAVARQLLGKEFASTKILLLQDTPNWAVAMLQEFCGIELHQLVWVHQFAEETILHTACIPTHCHSQGLLFHSYITELFRGAVPSRQGPASRRICVVRQKAGDGREFRQRAYFAELAMERGFELLDPGAISQKEQIAIFSQAAVIIGEYGSGMHNSVFAPPECQVVVVNVPGVEQTRLCAVFDQEIFLAQGTAEPGSPFWDLEPHLFHRAFDPANYERLERDDVT